MQDSSHLHVCGTSSVEACQNHDWVNSSVTTTEVLNLPLLAQLANISLYSSEQQLPLYTFSGQLYKSEEHKLHFMKAEKECKCKGSFWEYGEKEITHAFDPLTSSHTGQLPRTKWSLHKPYSLKAWRFYSHLFHQRGCLWLSLIPTGHNTKVQNAARYCMSRYPQHKPKLVIWTAKVF